MKRKRNDPGFIALQRAGLARRNADPKRKAAIRANIKRLNADPAFRARQRASVAIPAEMRCAIIAALRVEPNAVRVARSIGGASETTVRRIAKAEGIRLHRPPALTPAQVKRARRLIAGGVKQYIVARGYGVDAATISRYLHGRVN
jgi:hypothetical protein